MESIINLSRGRRDQDSADHKALIVRPSSFLISRSILLPFVTESLVIIIIIAAGVHLSSHAFINALSAHMIHINLNMIFYTHVEHSPTEKQFKV